MIRKLFWIPFLILGTGAICLTLIQPHKSEAIYQAPPPQRLFKSIVAVATVQASTTCGGTIQLVQSTGTAGTINDNDTQVSVKFNNPVLAGRSIIVAVANNDQVNLSTHVSDNMGNVYRLVKAEESGTTHTAIFYSSNVQTGGSNFTITYHMGVANYVTFGAAEVEGLSCSGIVDVSSTALLTGSDPVATSTFTIANTDLLVGVTANNAAAENNTPGSGFTTAYSQLVNDVQNYISFEVKVATAGVWNVGWTDTCGSCNRTVTYGAFR